jgi:tRNA (guanine37-N1)-methyltransferase
VRFDIVTLFPDCFTSVLNSGLLGKALAKQIAQVNLVNPRDFTNDKHRKVDDEPYGGGVGMLMKPEPIFAAVESLPILPRREVILMSPQGQTINQPLLRELAINYDQLIVICGHYEGIDDRVQQIVTREVSLGDFILTGGESFEENLLDYPQYTRPANFRGWKVPDVLLSGNHKEIAKWRLSQQIERTKIRRPDLLKAWEEQQNNNE